MTASTLARTPPSDGGPGAPVAGTAAGPHRLRRPSWPRRLLRGPAGQPAWVRPAVLALLAATGLLYLWDLTASGYANGYYAAAVQAGSRSWQALLFGSLDAGNAITVDKPPASLWLAGLTARVFGFSSWSVLAPQALAGVASVGLLHAAVRRRFGYAAGLLAAGGFALTPVAVLMFRFNHPDALLVLLMTAGGYCVVRATERAAVRWLLLAGVALGFGFLTKMLQAFLVLPAFGLAYLVAAPATRWRRVWHLLAAAGATLVSAGWYVALVALWPAGSRPYIGGSENDSLLQLALQYNGLGRIFGGSGNPGGGMGGGGMGGGNVGFGGAAGITRLFGTSMGAEISWLLPAALIVLVAGLWFTRHAPRTDQTRASLLLWGGWLAVTGAVFSSMSGIVHPYYTVALAPAIAALVAIGARELWRARAGRAPRAVLALVVAATGAWDWILLDRAPSWLPALRWCVLGGSLAVAAALLLHAGRRRRFGVLLAAAAIVCALAAPAAYAVATARQTHHGSIPMSGPAQAAAAGGPGGGFGHAPDGQAGQGGALTALLRAAGTRWSAAISGGTSAAELELNTGTAVIALGGWNGGDPSPTLAEFQRYVAEKKIHYLVGGGFGGRGGQGGPGGGQGSTGQITSWVRSHYPALTVDGATVYDLTRPVATG